MGDSLVTCSFCTVCDLLGTVGNTINFLLGVTLVLAVFFVVVSGLIRILSIGNKDKIALAKNGLKYSIIGLTICIVAWVAIHSFYQVIGYKGSNWWQIDCQEVSGENETKVSSKKYSDLKDLVPAASVNELLNENKKIDVIDLSAIELENLKQDLSLLKPGERLRLLVSYEDASDKDLNDYANLLSGFNNQINNQAGKLKDKFQEAASFNMYDGGGAVFGSGEYSDLTSDPAEENFSEPFNKLVQRLAEKGIKKIVVLKSGNSELNQANCVDSEGDWIEFKNECLSQKQICGKQGLGCSDVSNPVSGCQCQPGSCLVNGKCVKNNIIATDGLNPQGEKDEDGDGAPNSSDKCLGTPKGQKTNKDTAGASYGCSCSQLVLSSRSCPATRCEGANLATYPPSGQDQCSGGVITQYSCNPTSSVYNSTCDQTQNIDDFNDKAKQIQQSNPDLSKQLKDWLTKGQSNQNTGGNNGNSGGSGNTGGGNTGGTGGGNTGTSGDRTGGNNNTGTTGTGNTGDTGGNQNTGTGDSSYNPSSDLGKNGDFNRLAECIGFKKGEIPKNGALVGFYTDKSHTRMNVWYLDPRTGKAIGNNGDTTGQQPLVTYPQGKGNNYGLGGNGIYALQVQPHYSDDADTSESPLTARSDVKMTSSGTNPKDNWRINMHPGQATAGCLGTGNRNQSDGFMREMWKTVRGSERPADYNDDLSQKKGKAYDKHRARDTVLFSTMDAGTCQQPGAIDNAIKTLQSKNGYQNYDPQMINYSS